MTVNSLLQSRSQQSEITALSKKRESDPMPSRLNAELHPYSFPQALFPKLVLFSQMEGKWENLKGNTLKHPAKPRPTVQIQNALDYHIHPAIYREVQYLNN
jgi:hypothetical protein